MMRMTLVFLTVRTVRVVFRAGVVSGAQVAATRLKVGFLRRTTTVSTLSDVPHAPSEHPPSEQRPSSQKLPSTRGAGVGRAMTARLDAARRGARAKPNVDMSRAGAGVVGRAMAELAGRAEPSATGEGSAQAGVATKRRARQTPIRAVVDVDMVESSALSLGNAPREGAAGGRIPPPPSNNSALTIPGSPAPEREWARGR